MTIATILTTYSLFKRHSDLGEVVSLLRPISREAALEWAVEHARGNCFLLNEHGTWQSKPDVYKQLLEDVIPPELHTRAWQVFNKPGFHSPFTEVSLVTLIGLMCRYCRVEGGDDLTTREGRWLVFKALLALQDSPMPHHLIDEAARNPRADVKALFKAQFPYAMRTILANISQQNRWSYDMGRLHALIHVPEVGNFLQAKRRGLTVEDWFQRRIGVSATDYESIVNVHFGAAVCGADLGGLRAQQPALAPAIERLVALSETTPDELLTKQREPKDIYEATGHADWLLLRPLLSVSGRHLVTSVRNLFNKFHRGLPYLALDARDDGQVDGDARAEFGDIFQGYIVWLLTQWFSGTDLEVIPEYWAEGCCPWCKGRGPFEKDVVLIAEGIAYPLEIKASVPSLRLRRVGDIEDYCKVYTPVTQQAHHAARALIEGKAFYDQAMKRPIGPVTRAYPCAVGFEFNPLRLPYADLFEKQLSFDLGVSVFHSWPQVAPMQYLDVQQVEMWDDLFALPGEAHHLLAALRARAEDALSRFEPRLPGTQDRADYESSPGIVRRMTDEAEKSSSARLHELTGRQRLA